MRGIKIVLLRPHVRRVSLQGSGGLCSWGLDSRNDMSRLLACYLAAGQGTAREFWQSALRERWPRLER